MARKTAVANMLEPAPVRRSRRIAGTAIAARTEKDLLAHIATINDLGALEYLKMQMDSEAVPKTKAVKDALDEQRQTILRDAEENISPNAAAALRLASRRARRPLMRSYPLRFGNQPGPLRKSKARRTMIANNWARAIAAEEARIAQENTVAPPVARNVIAPTGTPFVPVPAGPADPTMNALAERFRAVNLGSLRRSNGLTPWNRRRTQNYLRRVENTNWGGESRGGSRKTRKIRGKRSSKRRSRR